MAVYIHSNNKPLAIVSEQDRLNGQVVLRGTDEYLLLDNGVFYLELLEAVAESTVTISDGRGNIVLSGITGYEQDRSLIRFDYGIEISGNVIVAKGYVVRNCFQENRS